MGSSPDSSGFPSFHPFYHSLSFTTIRKRLSETFHFWQPLLLLFTRCATSNASRHFKSPLAMGRDAFKSKHASSVSISGVIDTGVNSNITVPLYQKVSKKEMTFCFSYVRIQETGIFRRSDSFFCCRKGVYYVSFMGKRI